MVVRLAPSRTSLRPGGRTTDACCNPARARRREANEFRPGAKISRVRRRRYPPIGWALRARRLARCASGASPRSSSCVTLCAVVAEEGTAAARARSDDLALARRVVLRVSDFPSGWSGKPDVAKDSSCFTSPLKASGPTAFVMSQRLTSEDQNEEFSAIVVVYRSAAIAQRALTAATDTGAVRLLPEPAAGPARPERRQARELRRRARAVRRCR